MNRLLEVGFKEDGQPVTLIIARGCARLFARLCGKGTDEARVWYPIQHARAMARCLEENSPLRRALALSKAPGNPPHVPPMASLRARCQIPSTNGGG